MENQYDIIIAGGGLAGCVAASRLVRDHPEKSILITEKEVQLGGRLKSTNSGVGSWAYGLNGRSQDLVDYLDEELKTMGRSLGISPFKKGSRSKLGILSAGKISEIPLETAFSREGAHAIAGAAAARDWTLVDELMATVENQPQKADHHFSQLWKGTRKGAAAIVTEHLARLYGIPDVWSMRASDVLSRCQSFSDNQCLYDWEAVCHEFLKDGIAGGQVTLKSQTDIGEAAYENSLWRLSTTSGVFRAPNLIVAQNPWDALWWFPKNYWPKDLLPVPIKTKPISAVLLTQKIISYSPLPDIILVPAESVQIFIDRDSICVQATLNYESTLVAPEVVKAIRRLKRAQKKLLAAHDSLEVVGEHIALRPVAWSTPLAPSERRITSKMTEYKWQAETLSFCGDSYGPNMQGERNMIDSLKSLCRALEA